MKMYEALTKLAVKMSHTSKTFLFYFRLFFPAISLVLYSIPSFIVCAIPYLLGYEYHAHAFIYSVFHWMFPFWTGIDIEMDKQSKLLYNSINEPAIYISNHQTALDIAFVIGVKKLRTRILSKWENVYIPFLGIYMWLYCVVFINRKDKSGSIKTLKNTIKRMHSEKMSLWGFPEGTRNREQSLDLLPFKHGMFYTAVQAKVPIVPVVFENYSHLLDMKNKTIKPGKVACRVLAPIDTTDIGTDNESINELSKKCHQKMQSTINELYYAKDK